MKSSITTSKMKTDGNYEGQAYLNRNQDLLTLMYSNSGHNFSKEFFPIITNYYKNLGFNVEAEDRYVFAKNSKEYVYITYNSSYIISLKKKKSDELPANISDAYDLYDAMALIKND